MIRNSFIFLDKVGQKKEQQIWKQGIETWQDFLNSKIKGISPLIKKKHDQMIRLAKLNLCYENPGFFKDFMEHGEMWRIYPEFKDKAVYLDIETSGWNITCIGLYNGQEVKHFIRGINLNKKDFLDELYKYKVIITFNG
ncbi:MAG: hypothetical protein KKA65_03850, partial [Nanoarchaeota archaeon]|nr:hypothetical protein [Nanoarchaeota archaeon]